MAPTTHSQTLDELDTKVATLSDELKQGLTSLTKQFQEELHQNMSNLSNQFQEILMHNPGSKPKSHPHTSHSSHYENPHLSHSPWGSPNSWNKVPKVEMHKFDGSNPTGWVSQMEHYFSLHDIRDDETKLHVGVLYLDQE
jgi:hypothetical protein